MTESDKPKVYQLSHNVALKNCITHIRECGVDGEYEVKISPIKTGKTLSQLGGLFGLWAEYLSNETGESVNYIHKMWKSMFLARIYVIDHSDNASKPYPQEIDAWCELLAIYQESGQTEKFKAHAKRISLSWCNLSQMKRYMKAIEHHYMAEDMPLPILDKYKKFYK